MKKNINQFFLWFTHPKKKMDRTIMGSITSQFFVLLSIFLIVFCIWLSISYLGFNKEAHQINKEIPSRPWSILAQMVDPGNQHMIGKADEESIEGVYTLSMPSGIKLRTDTIILKKETINSTEKDYSQSFWFRLFVFLISITGTVIFTGLLVSTITNAFERRVERINNGLINYKFKNHTLIIGFDVMAEGLIKQLLVRNPESDIVIHTEQEVQGIKLKLIKLFNKKELKRIYTLYGDRTHQNELLRLQPENSREIYIFGEPEEIEYDHDARNIECMTLLDDYLNKFNGSKINCIISFTHPTTYSAFQFGNYSSGLQNLKLATYNFYEKWAQKVFVNNNFNSNTTTEYSLLDYKTIEEDSSLYVHLVILGMTRMGRAMAIEAMRLGHYANCNKRKTKITFIDAQAKRHEDNFRNCYQSLYDAVDVTSVNTEVGYHNFRKGKHDFINIELQFINSTVESPKVRSLLENWAMDPEQVLTVAVCFNYPPFSLSTAMYLPSAIFEKSIPVLVRQDSGYLVVSKLQDESTHRFGNLIPFGMKGEFCDFEFIDDWKAKRVSYYYSNLFKPIEVLDFSNDALIDKNWEAEKEKDKWANRYIIHSFSTKLRAVRKDMNDLSESSILFTEEELDLLARMEHARWNVERLIAGYIQAAPDICDGSMKTSNIAFEKFMMNGCDESHTEFIEAKKEHKLVSDPPKQKMKHTCIVAYNDLSNYYKFFDINLVKIMPVIIQLDAKRK